MHNIPAFKHLFLSIYFLYRVPVTTGLTQFTHRFVVVCFGKDISGVVSVMATKSTPVTSVDPPCRSAVSLSAPTLLTPGQPRVTHSRRPRLLLTLFMSCVLDNMSRCEGGHVKSRTE